MPNSDDKIFADYKGFIIVQTPKAVGLSTKKFGQSSDVEFWVPLSQLGRITYSHRETGDQQAVLINHPIEAIEIPTCLAREKGLAK